MIGSPTTFDLGPDMANGFASLMNISPAVAGFILGGMFVFTMVLVGLIVSSKLQAGSKATGVAVLMLSAFGFVMGFLLTWLPPWTIILAGLFGAIALVGPFGGEGGV